MGKSYLIDEKRIILYATGGLSCKVEELFHKSGKEIEAYIDRRSEDIKFFHSKKVYSLDEAERVVKDKDNYVVIITTKNVFEHSRIAAQLKKRGFSNIIFKDYRILQGMKTDDTLSIDCAFENILNQNKMPDGMIAEIKSNSLCIMCDNAYIKEERELIYAYVPASMLFTNQIENWVWSRVNFKTTFLTVELYKEFEGGKTSLREISQRYVQEFAKKGAAYLKLNTDGEWENFVITGRLDVFREMNDLFCLSPEFFIDNAPCVEGNSAVGFELISSGKNRVAFLMAKGYKYIPVKISKKVYDQFVNMESVKAIEEYINRENIVELAVPVPHPFFYKYPSKAPDYYEIWLERVGKDITAKRFLIENDYDMSTLKVLVKCSDNGAAERYFTMLGMQVLSESVQDEPTVLFNSLFYYTRNDKEVNLPCDYAVIFGDLNWMPILEKVSCACYIAGESDKIREKIVSIDSKEYSFDEIFVTFWDKREYSGYVLRKAGK